MSTRHAWLLALAAWIVASGAQAQDAAPAPAPATPPPAATPSPEVIAPAPEPVTPAPAPVPPVPAPVATTPEAAPPALEPAAPPEPPGPKVVWQGRVMTGFELQKSRPSSEQNGESETDYGFFVDQARLSLEAEWDDLSIDVSADLADAIRPKTSSAAFNKPPYLRNAYLNYRAHKAFRIRAGRFKRPMSALEMTSSGELPFRGRGLANELILEDGQWGDRAIGLMFYGRLPAKLRWHLSATNPSWAPDGDIESNGVDVIARLEWEPADILELGLSFGHKLEVRAEQEYQGNAASFDAALNVAGLRVALDAVLGQLTNQASDEFDAPLAYGVVGYATYQIPLAGEFALEPVLLGEYADSDSEFSRTEAIRMVIGCNLRLADRLRVMPQVEIVRPLGTAAQINPWFSSETYYLMMTAQL